MPSIFEWEGFLSAIPVSAYVAVAVAFIGGIYAERWRYHLTRRFWKVGRRNRVLDKGYNHAAVPIVDPADQLRVVMSASFEKRPLLSKAEARVLYAAEEAVAALNLNWRVMAQVSLGEMLSCPDSRAFSAINSKRVDFLIISSRGEPMAVIEYQGSQHYQGTAAARDAVKKEALRKAGVRCIEVTPDHSAEDIAREISRLPNAKPLGSLPTRGKSEMRLPRRFKLMFLRLRQKRERSSAASSLDRTYRSS